MAALREAGCGVVHVVLGAAADTVRERAALPGCVLVDNPAWEQGMGSSLRAGLESLAGTGAGAALVSLVDQPGIGAAAIARVAAAYRGADSWRRPVRRERGHPVLLGSDRWTEVVAGAQGDRGRGRSAGARARDATSCRAAMWPGRTTSTRKRTWGCWSDGTGTGGEGHGTESHVVSSRRISTSTNH